MERHCRVDAEHVALARTAQRHLDVADAVHAVGRDPAKGHARGKGLLDHAERHGRLGGEGRSCRNLGRSHAGRIIRPSLGQIQRAVDEGVTVPRHIGPEHPDLAVGDLARRAGVLPPNAAGGLALLEEAGLINDQHRILGREMLDHVVPHDVAQRIGLPAAADQTAASARIQPVLWRSAPSRPSKNNPAGAATLSCVNSGRMRALTPRNDDAQCPSTVSIEAPPSMTSQTRSAMDLEGHPKTQL
jgi:hypothetical protein